MTADAHADDVEGAGEEVLDGEMVELVTPPAVGGLADELPAALREELAELIHAAEQYAAAAQAPNTTRAYTSDWLQFEAWCGRYDLDTLPASPAACALYLTSLSQRGLRVSTVRRRAAAIARADRQAGYLPPTQDPRVLTVLEGIARVHGAAPGKKVALLRDPLLELVDHIDTTTSAGLRDRALLLLGFAVGLRRSELVAPSRTCPPPLTACGSASGAPRPTSTAPATSCSSSTPCRHGPTP